MVLDSVPFQHPWPEIAIGTTCSVEVGGTPSTSVLYYWVNGTIPWMSSGDVHQRHIVDVPGRITEKGLASSNAKIVEPPAVAIALAGQGKTRGTTGLVLTSLCTNQSVALVKPNDAELSVFYLFHNLEFRYEELRARSSGGGRAGLTKAIIESIPIPFPPLPEQRRIAEILDAADEAIHAAERLIAKLRQVKAGLLHDLLTCGVDAQGNLRDPAAHPEQFKDSPLGRIPREWEVASLNSLAGYISYGFTNPMPTTEQGPWMITAADITDGRIAYENARHTSLNAYQQLTKKSRPEMNSVLVTKDGTLGRVAILDQPEVCINQSVACIELSSQVNIRFILHYLQSPKGQEQMLADVGGSTIKHIYISRLGSMLVPMPSLKEGQMICDILDAHDARIRAEEAALAKLRRVKAGLMEDLLTGRVRV